MARHNELPISFLFIIVVAGMLILEYCIKPEYIHDCLAEGRTAQQCENSWKWRKYQGR